MKTFSSPIEVTVKHSFYFGSLQKGTLITGKIGDKFTAIGETKAYYITTNQTNNKLPKWITEN